jgi:DNA-binding beta-propeller fold protein YncE
MAIVSPSNAVRSRLMGGVAMKKLAVLLVMVGVASAAYAQANQPLKLVQTISIPKVDGRLDHLGIDVAGRRLFVAALGNNSLEVIDLDKGTWMQSVAGLSKPQGVYYIPKAKKVFVANGNDGSCRSFAGSPLQPAGKLQLSLGADLMEYDPYLKVLYVGHGGKDAGKEYGEFAIIDGVKGTQLGDIQTEAHPGGIAVERRGRVFVTLPEKNKIILIDPKKRQVTATWDLPQVQQPVSLALDEERHRLFVGSRKPPQITVLDTETGKLVANMETIGLLDGISYDIAHKRIYVSGGEGFVGVYEQRDADHYGALARIPTAYMARTSLFVPAFNRLFVALPRHDNHDAEIQVFEAQ